MNKKNLPEIGLEEEFTPEMIAFIKKDRIKLLIGEFGVSVILIAATFCLEYLRQKTSAPVLIPFELGTSVVAAVLIILGIKTTQLEDNEI